MLCFAFELYFNGYQSGYGSVSLGRYIEYQVSFQEMDTSELDDKLYVVEGRIDNEDIVKNIVMDKEKCISMLLDEEECLDEAEGCIDMQELSIILVNDIFQQIEGDVSKRKMDVKIQVKFN